MSRARAHGLAPSSGGRSKRGRATSLFFPSACTPAEDCFPWRRPAVYAPPSRLVIVIDLAPQVARYARLVAQLEAAPQMPPAPPREPRIDPSAAPR